MYMLANMPLKEPAKSQLELKGAEGPLGLSIAED